MKDRGCVNFQLQTSGERKNTTCTGPTTHDWAGWAHEGTLSEESVSALLINITWTLRARACNPNPVQKSTLLIGRHNYLRSLWICLQGAMIRYVQHPLFALHATVLGASTGGRQVVPLLSRVHLPNDKINPRIQPQTCITRQIVRPTSLPGAGISRRGGSRCRAANSRRSVNSSVKARSGNHRWDRSVSLLGP